MANVRYTRGAKSQADIIDGRILLGLDNVDGSPDGHLYMDFGNKRLPVGNAVHLRSLTIPNSGWVLASGTPYKYQNTVIIAGITDEDIINFKVDMDSEQMAQNINLSSICDSGFRSITFYANKTPNNPITGKYYIVKGET